MRYTEWQRPPDIEQHNNGVNRSGESGRNRLDSVTSPPGYVKRSAEKRNGRRNRRNRTAIRMVRRKRQ